MRRAYILLIVGAVVLVFLAISALLARVFSADGAERTAITSLVRAEARGNADAVAAQITACSDSAACRARAAANARQLGRPGAVSILTLQPSAGFSLTSTEGTARVAWRIGSSLPIVQCVRVRRAGNALSGLHIQLLRVSPRITSDAPCPAKF
jgi:hypothetical protein